VRAACCRFCPSQLAGWDLEFLHFFFPEGEEFR
jgi:hypothetical protein